MRLLSVLLAAISLIAFAPGVQARKAELVDPAPVMVPAGLSQEALVKDIKRTLAGRGWQVSQEQPGVIDSTLHLRDHVAKIKVTYDERQVSFAYVDSTNLDFAQRKNGRRYIHGNYLGWIGYLVSDLGTNMELSSEEQ
jgi:hypothetical protein